MAVSAATVENRERGEATPTPAQFRPVLQFLGFDPTADAAILAGGLSRGCCQLTAGRRQALPTM